VGDAARGFGAGRGVGWCFGWGGGSGGVIGKKSHSSEEKRPAPRKSRGARGGEACAAFEKRNKPGRFLQRGYNKHAGFKKGNGLTRTTTFIKKEQRDLMPDD